MAKRFFCTNIFDSVDMRKMKPEYKLFWFYLLAKCNHAGLWLNPDLELAEFQLGVKLDKKTIMQQFGNDIEIIAKKHLYLKKFVHFQYGELNPNVKAHLSVMKLLDKYSIRVNKEFDKSVVTLKDKDKVKVKDKVKDMKTLEEEFYKKVVEINRGLLPKEDIDSFCNYWTESNGTGSRKMRFQKEATFDIGKRLIRWKSNNQKWNKDPNDADLNKAKENEVRIKKEQIAFQQRMKEAEKNSASSEDRRSALKIKK